MQTKDPYKIDEINFDNIVYGKIKENTKKKVIYIKYQHKKLLNNLVFQLPTLLYNNKKFKENDYYEIELPISCKNRDNEDLLLDFFNNLNNKIIDDAKMNSAQWFGNKNSSKYQNFIRINKQFKKGSIRLKILKTPDFETLLKLNNKRIKVEDIPELCWCKVLVEFYAIWINENGFGGYLRPVLMYFKELSKTEYNYHLLDDSDEIDDVPEVNQVFIKQESENINKKIISISIIDSLALNDNLSESSDDSLEEILSSQTN
tara:strand:- start:453 stop:1232 length:780 start_codon:yes stop_codon:yes gene_type:complete